MKQSADRPAGLAQSLFAVERARWLLRRDRVPLALLVALYLLARLPDLWSVPLFNDETIYLLRAQRFPSMLGGTVGDGKLLQELALAALIWLPGDPLLWSRLLSIACGLGTVIALLLLGRAIDRPHAGLLAGILYAGAPLAILHDRLGLPDSMLTCATAYVLLASLNFARRPDPDTWHALAIGMLIGVAMLVKLPGLFFVYVPIIAVLALAASRADMLRRLALLRVTALVVVAALVLLVLARYGIFERHKTVVGSFDERIVLMVDHGWTIGGWLLPYLPAPLLILPVLALVFARHLHACAWRAIVLLLSSGLALHALFLLIGNTLYPRYLMPSWPPLLLACAVGAAELWRMRGRLRWPARSVCVVAVGAALAWDTLFAVRLQHNPIDAAMVAADRSQYLETWTAGYRMPEIIDTVEVIAAEQQGILLVNHYQPRLIHLAPELYLARNLLVTQQSLNLQLADAPIQLRRLATRQPTYLLLDEEEDRVFDFARRFPDTRLLSTFENPLGTMRFYLYEQPRMSGTSAPLNPDNPL
jgi:4-amino-4-deoxy-L-arabinose transferase-like glycosyltransferase